MPWHWAREPPHPEKLRQRRKKTLWIKTLVRLDGVHDRKECESFRVVVGGAALSGSDAVA